MTASLEEERNRPRTLNEAKAWMHQRLVQRVHPMALTPPEATAAAIDTLPGLDGERWASHWMAEGDKVLRDAEAALASGDRSLARKLYYDAYGFYFLGRFPCPNHPRKLESYEKARAVYIVYGGLCDSPLEVVRIPFAGRPGEGTSITAYVRRPAGVSAPPVVAMWGGVDAWKEEMTILCDQLLAAGIATVALDNVGTGESPIKAGPDGERQFLPIFDWIETEGGFAPGRLAIIGRSFGGHWATKLAHQSPARFCAAVNWGGGVHFMFQPSWIERSRFPESYLMELVETRCRMLGVSGDDAYREGFRALSLLDQGLLDGPCAPLLLVNGRNDQQCPNADIDLLLDHGDPKSVRLFPGGHMGFGPRTVPTIIGWLHRHLAARSA
ncbi:Alpha/beta hydrolase family protein [Devosia enhydra]|uniref:Alpha/beta hydrolase family protein n=1 Tax=Devosia enhydra TaxID=665118 RepID=A0A1K2HY20_9HYPH|nr:alpha/beta hydrolase [Devosia enhydra]SFZ84645.1 Alpha/beta hydrolase family protein [Devosia enhydra]